jgi:integrase
MKNPKMEIRTYTVLKNGGRVAHPKHPFVIDLRGFGNGREFFTSWNEANTRLVELQKQQAKHGEVALALSSRDLHEFAYAQQRLAEVGKTIREVVDDYAARLPKCSTTVSELAKMVLDKKRKHAAGETVKHADMYFKRICKVFGDRAVGTVTREEITRWLDKLTANQAKVYTHTANLFNEAVWRGLITESPMAQMKKPSTAKRESTVLIYTLAEIRKVLVAAQRDEPDIAAYFAIGAFAGVRSDFKDSELPRLLWSDVRLTPTPDFPHGHIQIRAEIAKKRKRRLIPIQPNLRAWLLPHWRDNGQVMPPPKAARTMRDRVFKAAGVEPKRNALRHSYATYRLAATGDAMLTARELGHPSVELVNSTYAELLTYPDEAARYWAATPENAG